MHQPEVRPEEALAKYEAGGVVLLDVRTPAEWVSGHVGGAVHIPMDELSARSNELDPDRETLVLCAHGIRSAAVTEWLRQLGFEKVANVRHGLARWPGELIPGA